MDNSINSDEMIKAISKSSLSLAKSAYEKGCRPMFLSSYIAARCTPEMLEWSQSKLAENEETLLQIAAKYGNLDVVKWLADRDVKCKFETVAGSLNHINVLEYFIDKYSEFFTRGTIEFILMLSPDGDHVKLLKDKYESLE